MKQLINRLVSRGPHVSGARRRSPLGVLAFMILAAVIVLYMMVPLDRAGRYLVSANYYIEWAATFSLIAAPPAAVILAFLHWTVTGRVFLSLLTVALGSFLTLFTVIAIVMGYAYAS